MLLIHHIAVTLFCIHVVMKRHAFRTLKKMCTF